MAFAVSYLVVRTEALVKVVSCCSLHGASRECERAAKPQKGCSMLVQMSFALLRPARAMLIRVEGLPTHTDAPMHRLHMRRA